MALNRLSTSTESTRRILDGIEKTPKRDGDDLWGRWCRKQRDSLTSAEIRRGSRKQRDRLISAEIEEGYQSSAIPLKDGPEDYRSNFKGVRCTDSDFLPTKLQRCQNPMQVTVAEKPVWSNSLNKTSVTWKTLDAGTSGEISDDPIAKSDPEDWDRIYAPRIKLDTETGEWNTVYNPVVFLGVIPPDQESEPESDSEDFDKVYTSEADIDTDEERLERWVDINDPGVFCGAVSVESDEEDDGERPPPQLLVEKDWLSYWPRAKKSIVGLTKYLL